MKQKLRWSFFLDRAKKQEEPFCHFRSLTENSHQEIKKLCCELTTKFEAMVSYVIHRINYLPPVTSKRLLKDDILLSSQNTYSRNVIA